MSTGSGYFVWYCMIMILVFTIQVSYNSFIDLQDKLYQNFGRLVFVY